MDAMVLIARAARDAMLDCRSYSLTTAVDMTDDELDEVRRELMLLSHEASDAALAVDGLRERARHRRLRKLT